MVSLTDTYSEASQSPNAPPEEQRLEHEPVDLNELEVSRDFLRRCKDIHKLSLVSNL